MKATPWLRAEAQRSSHEVVAVVQCAGLEYRVEFRAERWSAQLQGGTQPRGARGVGPRATPQIDPSRLRPGEDEIIGRDAAGVQQDESEIRFAPVGVAIDDGDRSADAAGAGLVMNVDAESVLG